MKTMDEVRLANLNVLIKEAGSAAALAAQAGTSPVYLSQLRNGSRSIGNTLARRLESACHKPNGWLDNEHDTKTSNPTSPGGIPLLNQDKWARDASAGVSITSSRQLSAGSFAVRITEKEMLPVFHVGDIVIVDPLQASSPGDYVLIRLPGARPSFGRYRATRNTQGAPSKFEIVPENEDFAPVPGDTEGLETLGVVVEQRRLYR